MALNIESAEHNMGIKVEGDIGDLQIIEEGSDSDNNSSERQDDARSLRTLSAIRTGLQSSVAPVFGSVAVTHSENVQFGNNTYFQGPVTIKQVIQSNTGIDNTGYNRTEDDINSDKKYHSKDEPSSVQKFKIQTWHKLVLSTVGVVIVSAICAVVIITQGTKTQDMPNTKNDQINNGDSSTDSVKVVVLYENYQVIIISIMLPSLTLLLMFYCSLLTKETLHCNESKVGVASDTSHICETNKVKGDKATILIASGHLRIVSRTDWLAQPVEKPLDVIRHPIPWVIITHTATEGCSNQSACVLSVRLIQSFHMESRGWYDIGYNFLVGGDGSVYHGRGWDYEGAHTKGYNKYSIGIAFIGTFNTETPPRRQVEACQKLIRQGVEQRKLAKDYKLFAHRQLWSTLSPGDTVYNIIKDWPHFVKNDTNIEELVPNY